MLCYFEFIRQPPKGSTPYLVVLFLRFRESETNSRNKQRLFSYQEYKANLVRKTVESSQEYKANLVPKNGRIFSGVQGEPCTEKLPNIFRSTRRTLYEKHKVEYSQEYKANLVRKTAEYFQEYKANLVRKMA
ncbi:MAG: hypothetical protein DRR19_18720 [Candidatus Parabeggiatoa sp. nov. 1]|nr:MAG: hypothetical protein DRR19_18720 [Gammaproteobacteria bacterium]